MFVNLKMFRTFQKTAVLLLPRFLDIQKAVSIAYVRVLKKHRSHM